MAYLGLSALKAETLLSCGETPAQEKEAAIALPFQGRSFRSHCVCDNLMFIYRSKADSETKDIIVLDLFARLREIFIVFIHSLCSLGAPELSLVP